MNLEEKSKLANLLENFHSNKISVLTKIAEGNHSTVFSYSCNEKDYIVRLNTERVGFDKHSYVLMLSRGAGVLVLNVIYVYKFYYNYEIKTIFGKKNEEEVTLLLPII